MSACHWGWASVPVGGPRPGRPTLNAYKISRDYVSLGRVCTLTLDWRGAGLDAEWLRGRGRREDTACGGARCGTCGQSQWFLLLSLGGLEDVPLLNLTVKQVIVFLNVLPQISRELVHATEHLSRFFVKLFCRESRWKQLWLVHQGGQDIMTWTQYTNIGPGDHMKVTHPSVTP